MSWNVVYSSNYPWIYRDTDVWADIEEDDFTLEYWINMYRRAPTFMRNTPVSGSGWPHNVVINHNLDRPRLSPWLTATGPDTGGSWTNIGSSAIWHNNYDYQGWEHWVYSRIGTGDNNFKVYRNNSLLDTVTNKADYDTANTFTNNLRGFGADSTDGLRGKFAVYRFYIGTGLTSSEVTTNWNAQKSRFGH